MGSTTVRKMGTPVKMKIKVAEAALPLRSAPLKATKGVNLSYKKAKG